MSHTPAPWTLAAGHSSRVLLINDARGHAVGEYVDTRNPADAHLIAAAPDLLAALQIIANSTEYRGDSFVCDFQSLQSVARAAIKKAAP